MKYFIILITTLSAWLQAMEIYVSPDGNDTHSGSIASPLQTLTKARDKSRSMRTGNDIEHQIILRAGNYHVSSTFELDQRDSNTLFRNMEGEEIFINGGIKLSPQDLSRVTNTEVLTHIPADVRSYVLEIDLPGESLGDMSNWPQRFRGYSGWPEVYVDGNPLRLSRWPNTGYAQIEEVKDPGSNPRKHEKTDRGGRFSYTEAAPSKWRTNQTIYLGGYWCFKWYDEFIRVESIDANTQQIQLAAPHQYGIGGPSKGLYFAINLLEELDQAGEYVYDGQLNKLYLILPETENNAIDISVLNEPLVSIKNAKNITFTGITFENGCNDGIIISDCEFIRIDKCTIRQMSGTGVIIKGGIACGVSQSRLKSLGKTGISLKGGDREALTPAKHFVSDCEISHFARLVQTYCPAIHINGVGQVISNNYLHDAPHCAILFGGNDHQFTFNHIERVCLDTSDAGAIYCGRDWTLGGNRLHGNFIHDLGGSTHHQNWAIYLDDMASGIEVSQNIVINTHAAFLIGGGRHNRITNNLIVNCPKTSIRFDARGVSWKGKNQEWLDKPNGSMWKKLSSTPYTSGIWQKRFPYLSEVETDAYKEPRKNIITGNMLFNTPPMNLDKLVIEHGTLHGNTHSDKPPTIQLKQGKLISSDPRLKAYESFRIGPRSE